MFSNPNDSLVKNTVFSRSYLIMYHPQPICRKSGVWFPAQPQRLLDQVLCHLDPNTGGDPGLAGLGKEQK
jgi:hypothetical protein